MSDWTLHLGDCIAGLATLGDKSVDHMISDPPYSDHTHSNQWIRTALTTQGKKRVKTAHAGLGFDCITLELATAIATQAARVCRRWAIAFTDIEGIDLWRSSFETAGLDYVRTCIWDKVDGAPQFTGDRPAAGCEAFVVAHVKGKKRWNGGGRRNVFRHPVNGDAKGAKPHPSTKPLALMSEIVNLFTDPGDLILDPFAGSGTTGVAARMLGRRFIGWELNPEYHAIACRRIAGEEARPSETQPSLFGGVA